MILTVVIERSLPQMISTPRLPSYVLPVSHLFFCAATNRRKVLDIPGKTIRYWGVKQSQGGRYAICFDEDCNAQKLDFVDGMKPVTDSRSDRVSRTVISN
jgi:hypothetical protein